MKWIKRTMMVGLALLLAGIERSTPNLLTWASVSFYYIDLTSELPLFRGTIETFASYTSSVSPLPSEVPLCLFCFLNRAHFNSNSPSNIYLLSIYVLSKWETGQSKKKKRSSFQPVMARVAYHFRVGSSIA